MFVHLLFPRAQQSDFECNSAFLNGKEKPINQDTVYREGWGGGGGEGGGGGGLGI